jgi:aspartyl protease family protein
MKKALLLMVLTGAGFGLMLPSGDPPAPVTAAVAAPGEMRETVLERSEMGHFYANAEVNGQLVRFVVDTGATTVALAESDAERLGIPFSRDEYTIIGSGASGPVRGKEIMIETVSLDGKVARNIPGVIIEGSDLSLLGQAYLGQFTIGMRGSKMTIS